MENKLFSDSNSALILSLHRGKEGCPVTEFKPWALAQIADVLDFDAASWNTCAGTNENTHTLDHCEFGRLLHNDAISISASVCDRHTTLGDTITLYRSTVSNAFNAEEQTLLELLLPHLSISYRQNQLYSMQSSQGNSATGFGAYAICDTAGVLHRASDAFTQLLLTEAPEWQGPLLPWKTSLAGNRRRHLEIKGDKVIINARRSENLFHLHIRLRTPIDNLSAAELKVARELVTGSSYKAAAQHLNLSPSTVNNHAAAIYRKLDVSNKAALISRWQELGGDRQKGHLQSGPLHS